MHFRNFKNLERKKELCNMHKAGNVNCAERRCCLAVFFLLIICVFSGCGNTSSKHDMQKGPETEVDSEIIEMETENTEMEAGTKTTETQSSESESVGIVDNIVQPAPQPEAKPVPTDKESTKEEIKFTEFIYDEGYTVATLCSIQIREKPDDSASALVIIPAYVEIEVIGFCNEVSWNKVRYNGIVGYVPRFVGLTAGKSEYGEYYFTAGTIEEKRAESGWHMDGGIKYWVWIVNPEAEHGGYWEARYEFCEDNFCSQEIMIAYLDKYCLVYGREDHPMKDGVTYYGQYDGEIYDYGKEEFGDLGEKIIMVVYLGGGPYKK